MKKLIFYLSVFILSLFLFTGCGEFSQGEQVPLSEPEQFSENPSLRDGFYTFNRDVFTPSSTVSSFKDVQFLPWTSQVRGTGFYQSGGLLFCGVNRTGLLVFKIRGEVVSPPIEYKCSPVFKYRTLGKVFGKDGNVYVHLYVNTIFENPEGPDSEGAPVFQFSRGNGAFTPVPVKLSFQGKGWQAVDLLPGKDSSWVFAWKRSGIMETEFRYVQYFAEGEKELSLKEYLTMKTPSSIENAPAPLRRLCERPLNSALQENGAVSGFEEKLISLKGPDPNIREDFLFGSMDDLLRGEGDVTELPAYFDGSIYYLLFGEGTIIWDSKNRGSGKIKLPPLPDGVKYTGLWSNGRYLLALWEEQKTHYVGKSGFYVQTISLGSL